MISERKIAANRRNAQKATGPKTEEGKSKVRLNAVTHGLCARTIVLPHEDEAAYQQRLDDWIAEMNPRTNREAYLVERAVRITWQLDRADFHERARLTRKIQQMHEDRGRGQGNSAEELLKRLLAIPRDRGHFRVASKDDPPRESPTDLVNRLQSTAEGCRALIEEWEGLWTYLAREKDNHASPTLPDTNLVGNGRIVRLLGLRDPEAKIMAATDRRVDALLEAQDLAFDDTARHILRHSADEEKRERTGGDAPPHKAYAPLPRPDAKLVKRLNEQLWLLVDENYQRLTKLLARREAQEIVEDESDEEAAFDDSPEGERLHRYQNHWSRMLKRTLDEFDRLHERTEEEPSADAGAPAADRHEEPPRGGKVKVTNQTHREIRKLAPSRPCSNPAPLRKATGGRRLLDLAGDLAPLVQPFNAVPRG